MAGMMKKRDAVKTDMEKALTTKNAQITRLQNECSSVTKKATEEMEELDGIIGQYQDTIKVIQVRIHQARPLGSITPDISDNDADARQGGKPRRWEKYNADMEGDRIHTEWLNSVKNDMESRVFCPQGIQEMMETMRDLDSGRITKQEMEQRFMMNFGRKMESTEFDTANSTNQQSVGEMFTYATHRGGKKVAPGLAEKEANAKARMQEEKRALKKERRAARAADSTTSVQKKVLKQQERANTTGIKDAGALDSETDWEAEDSLF